MTATSRELVYQALEFRDPARPPRQLWVLPWAERNHPEAAAAIEREFPPDIVTVGGRLRTPCRTVGDPYSKGRYVDEWGCVFTNLQDGVIGEVREPLVRDWQSDALAIRFPRELLTFDRDEVNRECARRDTFTIAGACPRPFEQLQFFRTTEQLYMDLADPPRAMLEFMGSLHQFYCELLSAWAATDVDGLMFMDDWGSQRSLLVNPTMWRAMFRPMYRDYIKIAQAAGKKTFMHSDGNILAIYPDLIEMGLDAVNSQLFCMGLERVAEFAGRITFWGEIDRQQLLPRGTTGEIADAVRDVHAHLWKKGGCIAQCEFGAGARPENVRQVFVSWDEITGTSGETLGIGKG